MNHLSYATSVNLKKFLGNSLPEPLAQGYYSFRDNYRTVRKDGGFPAYSLEDILSKPFCEAFSNKIKGYWPSGVHATLADKYWDGGFAAVEREIVKLIGGK